MMTQWLQVKDRDKVVSDDSTETTSQHELSMPAPYEVSAGKNKDNIDRTQTLYCYKWFQETGWIYSICEDVVVTGNRNNEFTEGNGGGVDDGGWPDSDGMPDGDDENIPGCGTCVGGITGKQSCCASFDKIMEFVLSAKSEGGYVNNPKDKGGPTNRGIAWLTWQETAQSTLGLEPTLANLKQLTKQQARKIYRLHFWRRSQADKFLDGDLAIFFFDFFINAPRSSTLRLQYLLSNMGYNVKIDGYIGGETRDAANYAIRDGKLKQLYNRYYQARIDHYKNRANTVPGQNTFLDGWLNRVNKFSEKTDSNLHNVNCNL